MCDDEDVRASEQPGTASDRPVEDPDDDTPKEACGVFGVYAPGQPVAHLTYLGLYALQHRGQESAGMAVSNGETLMVQKDMGLVAHVFDDIKLATLRGHLAIGGWTHVGLAGARDRSSICGSDSWLSPPGTVRHLNRQRLLRISKGRPARLPFFLGRMRRAKRLSYT